ncbi:MAG: class I SAM-dependent methyltransferase [Gemmataceae bacterium]
MPYLSDLFPAVSHRIAGPVCVALGNPTTIPFLVEQMPGQEITCFQLDLFPAARIRDLCAERELSVKVVTGADLWDLPAEFGTVLFPAAAATDRELKLDMIEQSFHILKVGGRLISLSEYEKDNQFAKWHKKVFGKCGETPTSPAGMAFWSTREADRDLPRRRHEINYHARLGESPSLDFLTRPGVFSYGRFDNGSRALVEVAEINPGDHVLDLGSGNGTVGCLASTKSGPTGRTTFIDSNLRAVHLSELNVTNNKVPNATILAGAGLEGLVPDSYDVVLANPPYYGDSVVARLFVTGSHELLKRGGRFYIVTKMPTAVVPLIFETFGSCDVIENRGYTVVTATA